MHNTIISCNGNGLYKPQSLMQTLRHFVASLSILSTLVVCAMPTSANAAVSITRKTVTVDTGSMKAVINRSPIRIQFTDANGNTVLKHRDTQFFGTPFFSIDPQPLGSQILPTPAKYAPFQYEVGFQNRNQWFFGPFVGNLATSVRGGFIHAARDVKSARVDGNGVRLELSTTEWGRSIVVYVYPDPLEPGSIRVNAAPSPSNGVISMGDSFVSGQDEQFYGFGGQHSSLSQRGKQFHSWTSAQNYGPGFLSGLVDILPFLRNFYLFPAGPHATYYSQSLFVSSKGYGVSVNEDNLIRWRMASDNSDRWQFTSTTRSLDYTVAVGSPTVAASKLSQINGRHSLPPLWAQGAIITRTSKLIGETAETLQAAVLQDLADIESRNVPIAAYVFEGAHNLPRDFVSNVITRLKALNIRTILYMRAYSGKNEPSTILNPVGSINEYDEAVSKGLVATNRDGSPFVFLSPYMVESVMFDFTNPRTAVWWTDRVKRLLDFGADGFMLDFGEQVLDGMHFNNGQTGWDMHQSNPIYMTQVTRQATNAYEAANPGREIFFYNRAGSSGRKGSAAYEQSNFSGDGNTDWSQSNGLPAQTTDMLNRAVGGAYGFNTDIGGYVDYIVSPPTTEELFIRWSQWAAFTPFFRVHNSSLAGMKLPWSFGENTYAIWLNSVNLHNRVVPLIRAQWLNALNGGPQPLQPLWMAAAGEPAAASEEQAWMIGPNLLAAPVVKQGATTKTVYLPAGCWNYAVNGIAYNGGTRVTVPAPLTALPYFTRCNTNPLGS